MIPTLSIIDDFLPGDWCEKLRREVIEQGFTTELIKESPDHPPAPYYTVNMKRDMTEFFQHVGKAIGQEVEMKMGAFRLGEYASHLHNYVHADHTCAQLACVYFLNPPNQCTGGTAFWRHKKHRWDAMPTQEELDTAKYTIEELREDWQKPEAWDMLTLAGMKTNRLIVYPTQKFHSRWPWTGFGDKPENSRLIYAGFFNVK